MFSISILYRSRPRSIDSLNLDRWIVGPVHSVQTDPTLVDYENILSFLYMQGRSLVGETVALLPKSRYFFLEQGKIILFVKKIWPLPPPPKKIYNPSLRCWVQVVTCISKLYKLRQLNETEVFYVKDLVFLVWWSHKNWILSHECSIYN